jgi:hypothetical protein
MIPFSQLLPLPDACIDQIEITGQAVLLSVHLETQSASCPCIVKKQRTFRAAIGIRCKTCLGWSRLETACSGAALLL